MTAPTCKTCPWYAQDKDKVQQGVGNCRGPRTDGAQFHGVTSTFWCHYHPDRQPTPCVECGGKGFQQTDVAEIFVARTLCADCNGRGKHHPRFEP